jgi:solute carrier family 35, member F1/2
MSATKKETAVVASTTCSDIPSSYAAGSGDTSPVHGAAEVVDANNNARGPFNTVAQSKASTRDRFAYLTTKDFWMVLLLGQILALCITGTNTLTTLLVIEGTSIPAFQTFFNYVLLNLIYTSFTIYKYGLEGWGKLLWKDGWKCKLAHLPPLPPLPTINPFAQTSSSPSAT